MNHRNNKSRPNANGFRNNSQKSLRRWHRVVGYFSLALVLILSITGLILNRTESLNLNQITVKSDIIAYLYNMSPKEDPVNFQMDPQWVSWLTGRLYLDGKIIAQNTDRPVGVLSLHDMIIIASEQKLSLYLSDGSLVETMGQSALPGKIEGIGKDSRDEIILQSEGKFFSTDQDFISWTEASNPGEITFARPRPAPPQIENLILQDFQGQGISLYRLILDLHSGNILGAFGSYLMDFAAICLIFLGITGLMKRKPNGKDSRQRKNKS